MLHVDGKHVPAAAYGLDDFGRARILEHPAQSAHLYVDAAIEYVGVAPLRLPQQILAALYGERLVKEHEQQPVHRVAEGNPLVTLRKLAGADVEGPSGETAYI